MGMHEIRIRLGHLSRQRTYQIVTQPGFPRPIAELAQGKVWFATDVEGWIRNTREADDAMQPLVQEHA